jgi:hypothetical protein
MISQRRVVEARRVTDPPNSIARRKGAARACPSNKHLQSSCMSCERVCKGIQWEWQATDGVMTQAPFDQGKTSPNPADRAKTGTKRSLRDFRSGYSFGSGCRWSQSPRLQAALCRPGWDVIARPQASREHPQHLYLDAGYDFPIMPLLVRARGYLDHIRSRGQEKEARTVRFLLRQCTSLRHPVVSARSRPPAFEGIL